MKKGIFVLICYLLTANLFAQEINKDEYRNIGDGRDLAWEIDNVSLKVGEKVSWTSNRAWQSGRWVSDTTTGTNSNVSADKNWRVEQGINYRFYGIVTGVDFYEGRMQTAIRLTLVEAIPSSERR
jgi:plastocyanin